MRRFAFFYPINYSEFLRQCLLQIFGSKLFLKAIWTMFRKNIGSCDRVRNENGEIDLRVETRAGDLGIVCILMDLEHGILNNKGETALI